MNENITTSSNSNQRTPVQGTSINNIGGKTVYKNSATSEMDWGRWIEENKNSLIGAFVVLVLIIIAAGFYINNSNKSKDEFNTKIYTFEQTTLAEFAKNNDAETLKNGFNNLKTATGNYVGLVPVVIKVSDALIKANKKEQALDVLKSGLDISRNDYARFFINTRLAVVYEDLGKNQEAIEVLTTLTKSDVKVFEGKFYLDMGRIYLKTGDNAKAKASFQYVVDKANDEAEFVKIAKLHLATL